MKIIKSKNLNLVFLLLRFCCCGLVSFSWMSLDVCHAMFLEDL